VTVRRTALRVALAAAACGVGGCPKRPLAERIQSGDPRVRRAAIVEAGEKRDATVAPQLVTRLTDPEGDVRLVAILALERITGTRRGYRYQANELDREAAYQRWVQWLKAGRAQPPSTQPASRPAEAGP